MNLISSVTGGASLHVILPETGSLGHAKLVFKNCVSLIVGIHLSESI